MYVLLMNAVCDLAADSDIPALLCPAIKMEICQMLGGTVRTMRGRVEFNRYEQHFAAGLWIFVLEKATA